MRISDWSSDGCSSDLQVAVLGVEHEEHPVEQDQRRLAHLVEGRLVERGCILAVGGGEGLAESRKNVVEDGIGQIAGDARFPLLAFAQRELVEGLLTVAGQEGVPPQDNEEEDGRASCRARECQDEYIPV